MFRFTIRELVLLTLVVALGVGWWLDRSRLAVPYADYQQLKKQDEMTRSRRIEFFNALRGIYPQDFQKQKANRVPIELVSPAEEPAVVAQSNE